jgi:hypothetical protein
MKRYIAARVRHEDERSLIPLTIRERCVLFMLLP